MQGEEVLVKELESDVVMRGPAPLAQINVDVEISGGATQEPPPTQSRQENVEEVDPEVDVVPQEPASIVGQEAPHEEVSAQLRDEGEEERKLEVPGGTGIDEAEDIPHSLFQATMPRGVRKFRSTIDSTKEIVVPPILKYVSSKEGATIVGSLLEDSL